MNKRKNITVWQRDYFSKIVIILLILSLILMVTSCGRAAGTAEAEYPPPQNLHITEFTGSGADRTVNLAWEAPDTEEKVIEYVVYRDDGELSRTAATGYQDMIGDSNYDFYITAIYAGDIESGPGNVINTATDIADLPPAGPGTDDDKDSDEETGAKEDADDKDYDAEDFNWDEVLSGPCGNPYYPVAEGISHTYSSSTGTITGTITSVSETGFTVTHTVAGSTQTHEWECLPEGLVDFSNPIGDALKVMGEGATVTGTTSVTGITIPSSISVGDTWSQKYLGTLDVQEYDGVLDFSVTISYSAVAEEEVTVPAGTFEALKVNSAIESNFTLKAAGVSMPLYTYNATGTGWWVENIGPVKTTTQGIIEGEGQMSGLLSEEFSDTTELIEYSLP
jgi:hypothetical protein